MTLVKLLFAENKPENEHRMKKKGAYLNKFETGEVGDMAFGVKVQKVQMMRGGRQGNNAFMEDPSHEHQTPQQYLLENEYCIEKIFSSGPIQEETLRCVQQGLGDDQFLNFITKSLDILISFGCYDTLLNLFKILGSNNAGTFFDKP